MKDHIENVRRNLSDLSALRRKTDSAERAILSSAEKRREWVQKRLQAVRAQAITDDATGDEYQDLVRERAQLDRVIEAAKRHIA